MAVRPPTRRPVLVVQRSWPQQENPALPLLPAGAPAVLDGRVATATAALPADLDALVAAMPTGRLELPAGAVLRGVLEHAVAAAGDVAGSLTLVAADLGTDVLVYALLIPVAAGHEPS
jgi:hypothetical protein